MAWLQHVVVMVIFCCFHMDAQCVTDEEFRDLVVVVSELRAENREQSVVIEEMKSNERNLQGKVEKLTAIVARATNLNEDRVLNLTIEERVTILEAQVVEIEEDVTDLNDDVNFLFDETVIQDERLLNLEEDTSIINGEVEVLQITMFQLDQRVDTLEENGGSDGNSSVAELEVRLDTLETTVSGQEMRLNATESGLDDVQSEITVLETRLTAAESELDDLQIITDDLETTVTVVEEDINDLEATDVSLDARVTALEDNVVSSEIIAFYAGLRVYDEIDAGDVIAFNLTLINYGNGYDSSTGVFTVPPGGDGVYYFTTHLTINQAGFGIFSIELNGDVICSALGDQNTSGTGDSGATSCSAIADVVAGDEINVRLNGGLNPLEENTFHILNGFNGFRI